MTNINNSSDFGLIKIGKSTEPHLHTLQQLGYEAEATETISKDEFVPHYRVKLDGGWIHAPKFDLDGNIGEIHSLIAKAVSKKAAFRYPGSKDREGNLIGIVVIQNEKELQGFVAIRALEQLVTGASALIMKPDRSSHLKPASASILDICAFNAYSSESQPALPDEDEDEADYNGPQIPGFGKGEIPGA